MMGEWVLSVGQLNEYVRRQLAGDPILRSLWVRGEISGFKRHYSGHLYFAIKDEQARVQCVMFRQHAMGLKEDPREGQRVTVKGSASLYVQSGSFQLYCEEIRPEGTGDMYARFEALKEKLSREGLFDPARKRPLPLLPSRIGVITSRSGAALRDILRVARRRDPLVDILICPAPVQGEGAARELAGALARLDRDGDCDLILIGRGGGSIEDLWAFNEEVLARAIYACSVPVISCVGHETDFTIADFVADVRAATPSMAAELAVPVRGELLQRVQGLAARLQQALSRRMTLLGVMLDRLALRLGVPVQALIGPKRERLVQLSGRLARLGQELIRSRDEALQGMGTRLNSATRARLLHTQTRLEGLERTLAALDPGNVLQRGYALVKKDGRAVADAKALHGGEIVSLRLRDGEVGARILAEEERHGNKKETEL
jgi:exodeoxyribonuclease VII large subunit